MADGSRHWNSLLDMLRDCMLRLVLEDCFTADGKDVREVNVDLMPGKETSFFKM